MAKSMTPLDSANATAFLGLLDRIVSSAPASRALHSALLIAEETLAVVRSDSAGLARLGTIARQLFEACLTDSAYNDWRIGAAVRLLVNTHATSPAHTEQLLRRLIDPARLPLYGYREIPRLIDSLCELSGTAPTFVSDLYVACFQHRETSTEKTLLVASAILPMSGNRKQDWNGALYNLAKCFPSFMTAVPGMATDTLLRVTQVVRADYLNEFTGLRVSHTEFVVGPVHATMTLEPGLWGEYRSNRHEYYWEMLDKWRIGLEGLLSRAAAGSADDLAAADEVIARVISDNTSTVIWRSVLEALLRTPDLVPRYLDGIDLGSPLLSERSTRSAAVRVAAGLAERRPFDEQNDLQDSWVRDLSSPNLDRQLLGFRLLSALPERVLTTAAKKRLALVRRRLSREAEERPLISMRNVNLATNPEIAVPPRATSIQSLSAFLDHNPLTREVAEVAGEQLSLAVTKALGYSKTSPKRNEACRPIVTLIGDLLSVSSKSPDLPVWSVVRRALLIIERELLVPPVKHIGNGIVSGDDIRGHVAECLVRLLEIPGQRTKQVQDSTMRLLDDPDPHVRTRVYQQVGNLVDTQPRFVWFVAEQAVAREDETLGQMGVAIILEHLADVDAARAAALFAEALHRWANRESDGFGAEWFAQTLITLCVRHGDMTSWQELTAVADQPERWSSFITQFLHLLRSGGWLTRGDQADAVAAPMRLRAVAALERIAESAAARLSALKNSWDSLSHTEREQGRRIVGVLDGCASQLMFASGAFEAGQTKRTPSNPLISFRFYREAKKVVDTLADVGLAHVAHNLITTLRLWVPADPKGVLLRIRRVVQGAQYDGYQTDSMAEGAIVELVEEFLARYRQILESDLVARTALLDIIDVFIDAGWPRMRRLGNELDVAYR